MFTLLILATMVVVGLSYVSFARRVATLQQEIVRLSVENTGLKASATVLPPSPFPPSPLPDTAETSPRPADIVAQGTVSHCAAPAIIAVVELREAVRAGTPFTTQITTVSSLVAADLSTALSILTPLAAHGVPTLPALQQHFASVKEQLVRIATQLPEHPSLGARLKQTFSKVITIRRINPPGAIKDNTTLISDTEAALAEGNVAQAVYLLGGLTGDDASQAAAPWLEQANAFLNAEKAVDDLYHLVISPSYGSTASMKGTLQ